MSEMWKNSSAEKHKWFLLDFSFASVTSLLFTLVTITVSILLFINYGYLSNDPTPDSLAGYTYASAGTLFMLSAALSYSLYRRSRNRSVGRLNGALHWHISFGMIAIALLFLHSFGNFNPRSGTYALYGMVALVISGTTGRVLDRIVPKLITHEVKRMFAGRGEDRVDPHTQIVESTIAYDKPKLRSLSPTLSVEATQPLLTTGNLAYTPLAETSQGPRENGIANHIVPESRSDLDKLVTLIPDVEERLVKPPNIQRALRREEYYRAIIRYWRIGHILLAFVAIGLMLWHLEYVATLLVPMFFK